MGRLLYPNYYKQSKVYQELLNSNELEVAKLDEQISEKRLIFFATLSHELTELEQELGLSTNENEDENIRRGKIIARLRTMPYATIEKLTQIGQSFLSVGRVVISEKLAEYLVIIEVENESPTHEVYTLIKQAILEILPAHLALKINLNLDANADYFLISPTRNYTVTSIDMEDTI